MRTVRRISNIIELHTLSYSICSSTRMKKILVYLHHSSSTNKLSIDVLKWWWIHMDRTNSNPSMAVSWEVSLMIDFSWTDLLENVCSISTAAKWQQHWTVHSLLWEDSSIHPLADQKKKNVPCMARFILSVVNKSSWPLLVIMTKTKLAYVTQTVLHRIKHVNHLKH